MQELERILEEIDLVKEEIINLDCGDDYNAGIRDMAMMAKQIINKHRNDGWIPVGERLPENAKHKGVLCPRYQLSTKYGVTEGWYNPDLESWFVLCWFLTEEYSKENIDFERGSCPQIVQCENKVNDKNNIVLAWRPLPEPYRKKDR